MILVTKISIWQNNNDIDVLDEGTRPDHVQPPVEKAPRTRVTQAILAHFREMHKTPEYRTHLPTCCRFPQFMHSDACDWWV
jgi:hypothetical protein